MAGRFYKVCFIIFCLISTAGFAQKELDNFIQKYPDVPFIYLKKTEKLDIQIKDCKLDIESRHYTEKLSLQNSNHNYSDEYIGYSSFSEIKDIKALFLEPKGNKYQKTKIENIVTSSPSDNSVFYDDYSHKRIVFPNLHKGCKSVLSYTEKIKDPHLVGFFMFTGFMPVEYAEYSVTYPKEVNISYKIFNNENNIVKIEKNEHRSETTLRFYVKEYTPGYSLNNDFNSRYYLPHVIIYINNYTTCGKNTEIFENVASLHNWYYELSNPVNTITPEIQNLSDSITAETDSKIEKLKSVFYWVQDNIKYVAFESGYEGFIPRNAEKVLTRKYGDCKDMANLTTQLLKAAGINAYLSWVGTRSIPYSYEELPAPFVDNHMISTAEINGKYYFLDATGYVAYNYPTDFILSKEVLVSKGAGDFKILKIPVIECEQNEIKESLNLKINKHTLAGEGAVKLSGYHGFDISVRTQFNNKENEEKIILNHVVKGSDKFQLENYELVNFTDRDKNNIIKYAFHIPDYVKSFEDKMYINLNLSTPYSKRDIDLDEKLYALKLGSHSKIDVTNILQIPENYTVTYLPDSSYFNNGKFSFNIHYTIKENKVFYNFTICLQALKINPDDFAQWNQFIKSLNIAYKKTLELTKTK